MSSGQVDLYGEPVWMPNHLQQRWPGSAVARENAEELRDLDREAFCTECHRRVTMAPDGKTEYGHDIDCSFSAWGRDQ